MVVGPRVAQLDARLRGLRQACLEIEDGPGLSGRLLRLLAEQGEHLLDMLAVGGTDRLRLLVGLQVVVAIRQAESALEELGDHPLAVLEVRAGAEAESNGDVVAVEPG